MDIPQVLAERYRIEREIGRGGMGTVYRATHLGLERTVAVKVLKQEFAADPGVADRFMREARTMARLRHPRAAIIFDAGRLEDGRPFIVMEYVEGRTLAETLASEGSFTPERAVRVASEICEVLAEAHDLGIVHRDLKPSNIILNERGVCVLDFGIAKVLADSTEVTRTHATTESGLVIGTPRYMSPEQCIGRRVGAASDLYSVGVLVYEMLAGRPPFIDQMASAVLVKQATATPPNLLSLRPDLPPRLVGATHRLLAKDPARRPPSADDVRTLLQWGVARERANAGEGASVSPLSLTVATLEAGGSAALRAAAVVVMTTLLGALLFAWANNREAGSATSNRNQARASRGARANRTRAVDSDVRPAPQTFANHLAPADAQRIAVSATPPGVDKVQVLRARHGDVVAALHNQRREGKTHIYFMEQRGARYGVVAHSKLDVEGFRGATWSTEVLDADGDGYDEILCTGERPNDGGTGRRFVLYVPNKRRTYTLRITPDARRVNTIQAKWSPNALDDAAQPYRLALRQRAFATPKAM